MSVNFIFTWSKNGHFVSVCDDIMDSVCLYSAGHVSHISQVATIQNPSLSLNVCVYVINVDHLEDGFILICAELIAIEWIVALEYCHFVSSSNHTLVVFTYACWLALSK